MTLGDWANKNFSTTEVSLPGNLSDRERRAIRKGAYELGMSRRAIFLAVGYPPKSLTPDERARNLKYAKKRFNSVLFTFDHADKLAEIID